MSHKEQFHNIIDKTVDYKRIKRSLRDSFNKEVIFAPTPLRDFCTNCKIIVQDRANEDFEERFQKGLWDIYYIFLEERDPIMDINIWWEYIYREIDIVNLSMSIIQNLPEVKEQLEVYEEKKIKDALTTHYFEEEEDILIDNLVVGTDPYRFPEEFDLWD